jgi:hypothetical protein
MTTQPEQYTDEQIEAMLEQIAQKGGTETLKKVRDISTKKVKDSTKANHAEEIAERTRKHKETTTDFRVAGRTYLELNLPDDKSNAEHPNQEGSMLMRWFREDNGERRVTFDLPKLKAQGSKGERQKGTAFIPLKAKLCLGASEVEASNAGMQQYLEWLGINNVTGSVHDRIKKLVEALNTPGSKAIVGTATKENLIIKDVAINGGNPTRLCDHYEIAYTK